MTFELVFAYALKILIPIIGYMLIAAYKQLNVTLKEIQRDLQERPTKKEMKAVINAKINEHIINDHK